MTFLSFACKMTLVLSLRIKDVTLELQSMTLIISMKSYFSFHLHNFTMVCMQQKFHEQFQQIYKNLENDITSFIMYVFFFLPLFYII